jgi:hypothetical protein
LLASGFVFGDRLQVKLSGGRIVEATIKAIVETTEGLRLQVSFGEETALIYLWQIVIEARWSCPVPRTTRDGFSRLP